MVCPKCKSTNVQMIQETKTTIKNYHKLLEQAKNIIADELLDDSFEVTELLIKGNKILICGYYWHDKCAYASERIPIEWFSMTKKELKQAKLAYKQKQIMQREREIKKVEKENPQDQNIIKACALERTYLDYLKEKYGLN